MAKGRQKEYTIYTYVINPDGSLTKALTITDALGKNKKVTMHIDERQKTEYNEKLLQGISDRVSQYYDDDGNFIDSRI